VCVCVCVLGSTSDTPVRDFHVIYFVFDVYLGICAYSLQKMFLCIGVTLVLP